MFSKNNKIYYRKNIGWTLIEVIVVIIILGLISAIGALLFQQLISSSEKFNSTKDPNYWQAQTAMLRMVNNIRSLQYIFNDSTNTSLHFLDFDGNSYTYNLNQQILLESEQSLASNISSLQFAYFSSLGYLVNSSSNDIKCIGISLVFSNFNNNATLPVKTLVCPPYLLNRPTVPNDL